MSDNKIISIQLLRAIASLLVLQVHFFTTIPFTDKIFCGSIGVDIFFVISGYIISASVVRIPPHKPALNFFINRFSRVAPYYYLLTIIVALLTLIYARQLDTERLIKSILFIPDKSFDPTLFPGWSLIHEMFFYVFVSAAISAFPKIKVISIGICFFCVILFCSWAPFPLYIFTFFGATINYTFLLGLFIFVYKETIFRVLKGKPLFFIACLLFLLTALLTTDFPTLPGNSPVSGTYYHRDRIFFYKSNFYLPRIIAWGIPSALLFISFFTYEEYFKKWRQSLMVRIGDASYSLYLLQGIIVLLVLKIKFLDKGLIRILLAVSTVYAALKMLVVEEAINGYCKRHLKQIFIRTS